ncbi:hypothetical protein F4806DRAFT_313455 [Annulohypoxylon nitens]|nr:hypothetical protein F4806DRAFT_313455 [Annulohypoxylon nitens]
MAKKTKSRIVPVRLISMAMTGFFYSYTRPRTSRPLSMLKYDPVAIESSPARFSSLLDQLPLDLRVPKKGAFPRTEAEREIVGARAQPSLTTPHDITMTNKVPSIAGTVTAHLSQRLRCVKELASNTISWISS